MTAPKHLMPGDMAWTDYCGSWRRVRIIERSGMRSQTGICYRCDPDVSKHKAWLDAAWFYTDGEYEVLRDDRNDNAT